MVTVHEKYPFESTVGIFSISIAHHVIVYEKSFIYGSC